MRGFGPILRSGARGSTFATALLLFGCGQPADPSFDTGAELTSAIADAVRASIEADGRGGAALGLFAGGHLLAAKGIGLAAMDTDGDSEGAPQRPVKPDDIFRIGSITKPVTAMTLLRLIHEEKARFGDPVARFVPELDRVTNPFPWTPEPTLFQLGTMTAGIAREPENLPEFLIGLPADWMDVAFRALAVTSFEYEPGTRYQYSNIGYAVLGAAAERAGGQPFMELATASILDPLGMDSTVFFPTDAVEGRIAAGYSVQDDGSLDAETPAREHAGRGYKVPNGALYSTVEDLHVFLQFLTGNEGPPFDAVLPAEVRRENLTRAFASGDLSSGYGFGFMTRRLTDADGAEFTAYGHGGSVAGYRAAAWIEPQTGAAVVLLRNVGGDGQDVGELATRALGRLVAGHR